MRRIGKIVSVSSVVFASIIFLSGMALADDAGTSQINSGDTAFMMISAALVLLMTPGLAFFYGGLVRRKNVLSILMQCFIPMCILTLQWILFGYSLSFGPDVGGIIGDLSWIGLTGVGLEPHSTYATTIPHQLFMVYQGMFAIITPALIVGAFTGRVKFSSFFVFIILWATFVYDPMVHWVWGGGWLSKMGALDFAGGAVVHINAGIAALVMALLVGKRKGHGKQYFPPHNLPFTVLGAGLLWFGWFGFNAGSALAANGIAVNAFVTTNTAGAAAGLAWALIEWKHNGAPTMLGVATGAVAGLACVTPAAGFVSPMSAIAIGALGSVICFLAVVYLKPLLKCDDSLDVFGVHGVGGIWGVIATGIFATATIGPANGLIHGELRQFGVQVLCAAVTMVFSAVMTFILYKAVDALMGMRVSEEHEVMGLDMSQHKEVAYTVLE